MTATPLQWNAIAPEWLIASGEGCVYSIGRCEYPMLSQWQTFRSGPDVENHSERIFLGFDRARAMRMAEEHHAENVRRLAWERYMQENDPPIAHELPRVDRTSQQ